jgi:hypothetical protein
MSRFFSIIVMSCFLFTVSVYGQSELQEREENIKGGVLTIKDRYQIFPVNRLGNTIYVDNKKLASQAGLAMIDLIETSGGFVYHAKDETEQSILGFAGEENAKFKALDGGFYLLSTKEFGNKIYRLNSDNMIQNLLPRYKTAGGLVYNNADKAAFFHISKGENIETEDGKLRYLYTFKIHVAKIEEPTVINLPLSISDYAPNLRMTWIDEETLQYSLSDGSIDRITIK